MSKPHQISSLNLKIARNLAVIEGVIATGLAAGGTAFIMPLVLSLICLTALVAGKTYNHRQLENSKGSLDKKAKELSEKAWYAGGGNVVDTTQTEFDCPNYDQVSFEMRMVEAKVMTLEEVTLCELDRCKLCAPLKKRYREEVTAKANLERAKADAIHKAELAKRRAERHAQARQYDEVSLDIMSDADRKRVLEWQDDYLNDVSWGEVKVDQLLDAAKVFRGPVPNKESFQECQSCRKVTWFELLCPTCRLLRLNREAVEAEEKAAKQKAEREAAEKAKAEAAYQARRGVVVEGLSVIRPTAVPEGAVPALLHGRDIDPMATHSFIVWKWTEDGINTKFFKQPITIDAVSVQNGHGQAVKSFYSAHDETGRYMGDYSTTNGKIGYDNMNFKAGYIERNKT